MTPTSPLIEPTEDPPVPKGAWVKVCNMKLSEREKATKTLIKAFTLWKASTIEVFWLDAGCTVELTWDWPTRTRVVHFTFAEPL